MTYKEIRKTVTVEISTLFLLPYVVAVIHSSFVLLALKNSLDVDVAGSSFLVMGSFCGFTYILLNCKTGVFKWNKRTLDRLN